MKVLVTGGLGFVGVYVREELLKNGADVLIYDIGDSQGSIKPGAQYIRGDIFDLRLLQDVVQRTDFVIHLVGVRDAHVSATDPDKSFRLNVLSLHNVLEACRLGGVRRLLFPSSAAIYGRTDKIPVSEEDPPRPTGIYAYHKWLCEELIRAYRATYGLHYTIFRLFNAYGKGNRNIIHHCIASAKAGKPLRAFGADQLRDFIFIGDVARAFRLALSGDGLDNRTINIGSGRAWTIRGVVRIIQRVLPELEVEFAERDGFIPYHSVADVTLARTLLGFSAESSEALLEKVIREMGNDA